MKYYPRAHLWLLIPFVVAIGGFSFSYWFKLFDVPFRYHVHGLSATLWYMLLIIQPYIYQRKKIQLHRTIGKFSLLVAGAVFASALLMLPNLFDLGLAPNRVRTIIFQDGWTSFGYIISVFMAIKESKNIHKHSRWMIVTAFWPLGQALFRLLRNILSGWNFEINYVIVSQVMIILTIAVLIIHDLRKEKKIYASYGFTFISFVLILAFSEYMGEANWWKLIIAGIFKEKIV
jgi:hypothetical protein